MGQPGSFSEPLPRSPNSRVLPPSAEPGLWSADRPRAARQEYLLPPVLGFTPPAVMEEEAEAAVYADNCSRLVDDTRRLPSVAKALGRVSGREAACTGAQAYFFCLGKPWLEASAKKDRESKAFAQALLRYQLRLQAEMKWACKGLDLQRPDLLALLRMVETAWTNTVNR
jgi:hypothetical protein